MLDMHRCCYCLSVIAKGDSIGRCGRARTWQKSSYAQISAGKEQKRRRLPPFLSDRLKSIAPVICCSKSLKRSVKKLQTCVVHFLVPVHVGVFVSVVRDKDEGRK